MGNDLKKPVYKFNSTYFKIFASCLFFLSGVFVSPVSGQIPAEEIVSLDFEYPDQIDAGESFIFTVILNKADNYLSPGNITCTFSGGIVPGSSQISDADFTVDNASAIISWNKLSGSNIIHFPVTVKTEKNLGGVYPVRVNYADDNGLQIYRNIGVFITGEEKPDRPPRPMIETPYTVNLVYPEEVSFDEEYNLDIVIAKGKNTGGAKVFMQIPPQSELISIDYPDYHYKKQPGDLCILLNSMPASPEFSIRCKLKNTSQIKSVYPVRATVEFLNGNSLSFSDFILVTDTKSPALLQSRKNSLRSVNAAVNADTASLFDELDRLLSTWEQSAMQLKNASREAENKARPTTDHQQNVSTILTGDVIFYSIQIAASQIMLTRIESQLVEKGIEEKILEDYDGRIYRYSVGDFENLENARAMREKLQANGYPDAFIVEYVNGIRERSFY